MVTRFGMTVMILGTEVVIFVTVLYWNKCSLEQSSDVGCKTIFFLGGACFVNSFKPMLPFYPPFYFPMIEW